LGLHKEHNPGTAGREKRRGRTFRLLLAGGKKGWNLSKSNLRR